MVLCFSWLRAAFATITLFGCMHRQYVKSIPANLVQLRGVWSIDVLLSETARISDVMRMRLALSGQAGVRCSAGSRRAYSCIHLQVIYLCTKSKRAGSPLPRKQAPHAYTLPMFLCVDLRAASRHHWPIDQMCTSPVVESRHWNCCYSALLPIGFETYRR